MLGNVRMPDATAFVDLGTQNVFRCPEIVLDIHRAIVYYFGSALRQ